MGAVAHYVRALTAPGDLVVDLFCHGPAPVREVVETGRRALGLSINPLLLLAARLALSDGDPQPPSAAFTHLANGLKGGKPLQTHLTSLYRAACPTCGTLGVAEWFAWDRDLDLPFEKAVRCTRCPQVQTGPTDSDDTALARSIEPRGLAYYYALDRAAPLDHPARDRAAELVDCYTARNLSALMDLNRRLEGLKAPPDAKAALMAVLLDCFDQGSKLYPYDEHRSRPRTLRIPVRYYERNVWLLFEEGFSSPTSPHHHPRVTEAGDAGGLVRGEKAGYALTPRAARDIRQIVPEASVALLLVDPPRPDGVFWALSALWATWLWNSPESHAMRPFLRRRRFDWGWHWRALREALMAAGPCLVREGSLVTLSTTPPGALLESVCMAASNAGYHLSGWGYAPEVGYRLVWDWRGAAPPRSSPVETFHQQLISAAQSGIVNALRQRGEPTPTSLLHASAWVSLVEQGRLPALTASDHDQSTIALAAEAVDHAFAAAPILALREEGDGRDALWWLSDEGATLETSHPAHTPETLADRVEEAVRSFLAEQPVWTQDDLINAVYARFPGVLTPDLTLVQVCVDSYGISDDGEIRLRPEDDHQRRCREIDGIREGLLLMGEGLGYDPLASGVRDVRWLDEGRESYVFLISSSAAVAPYLLDAELTTLGARRCLVVPGGRARLIDLKLQRDPRLTAAVENDQWQFIKFRHLRRLTAKDDLDRYALTTVLGLDPIVEQEGAQIPLF